MKILILLFGLLMLNACSTAKVNVLPGEDGINRVVSKDIEKDDAEEAAVKAANKYCKEKSKEAIFVKTEDTKYTGSMDEHTRKTVRNASKAAGAVGSAVGVMGGDAATRTGGGILGGAGGVGYAMTSDRDYTSEMKFKCK